MVRVYQLRDRDWLKPALALPSRDLSRPSNVRRVVPPSPLGLNALAFPTLHLQARQWDTNRVAMHHALVPELGDLHQTSIEVCHNPFSAAVTALWNTITATKPAQSTPLIASSTLQACPRSTPSFTRLSQVIDLSESVESYPAVMIESW